MKKNLIIACLASIISANTFAAEPVYSFKQINESKTVPHSLNGFKKTLESKSEIPKNAIKIKILPLLFSTASFQYERVISEKLSVACDFNYLFYTTTNQSFSSGSSVSDSKVSFSGFGISPELRLYPGEEALKGFFVGPYINYLNMSIKVENTESNGVTGIGELKGITALGAGVLLGWKWLVAESFSIEAHTGLNYLMVNIPTDLSVRYSDGSTKNEEGPDLNASGLLPTLGFSLGYAY
jgi:hypothetical protein